jgi:hypothetical protein
MSQQQSQSVNVNSGVGAITATSLAVNCSSNVCNEGEPVDFVLTITTDGQVIVKNVTIYAQVSGVQGSYQVASSNLNIFTEPSGQTTVKIPTSLYIPMNPALRQKLLSGGSIVTVNFYAEITYNDGSTDKTISTQQTGIGVKLYPVCISSVGFSRLVYERIWNDSIVGTLNFAFYSVPLKFAELFKPFFGNGIPPPCIATAQAVDTILHQFLHQLMPYIPPFFASLVATGVTALSTATYASPYAELLANMASESVSTPYDAAQSYAVLRPQLVSIDSQLKQFVSQSILSACMDIDPTLTSNIGSATSSIASGIYAQQFINALSTYASDLFINILYSKLGYESLSGLAPTRVEIDNDLRQVLDVGQRAGVSSTLIYNIVNNINSDVESLVNLTINGKTQYSQLVQQLTSVASQMDNLRMQARNLNVMGINALMSYPRPRMVNATPLTPNMWFLTINQPATAIAPAVRAFSQSSNCCNLPACSNCTPFGTPGTYGLYGLDQLQSLLSYTPSSTAGTITWQFNPTLYYGYFLYTTLDYYVQVDLPAGLKIGPYASGIEPLATFVIYEGLVGTIPPCYLNNCFAAPRIYLGLRIEADLSKIDWASLKLQFPKLTEKQLVEMILENIIGIAVDAWKPCPTPTNKYLYCYDMEVDVDMCDWTTIHALFSLQFFFFCRGKPGSPGIFTLTFRPFVEYIPFNIVCNPNETGLYPCTVQFETQPPQQPQYQRVYAPPITFEPPPWDSLENQICSTGPGAVYPPGWDYKVDRAILNTAIQWLQSQFTPVVKQLNDYLIDLWVKLIPQALPKYPYPHPIFINGVCSSYYCTATAQASPGQTLNYSFTIRESNIPLSPCGLPQWYYQQQQQIWSKDRYFRVCLTSAPSGGSIQVTVGGTSQTLGVGQCLEYDLGQLQSQANLSVSITIPSNAPSGQYWVGFDTSYYTPSGQWIQADVQYLNIGVNTAPSGTGLVTVVPPIPPPSGLAPNFIWSYWSIPSTLTWTPNTGGASFSAYIYNMGGNGTLDIRVCLLYAPQGGSIGYFLWYQTLQNGVPTGTWPQSAVEVSNVFSYSGQASCQDIVVGQLNSYIPLPVTIEIVQGTYPMVQGTYVMMFAVGYVQNNQVTITDKRLVTINVGTPQPPPPGVINNLISQALTNSLYSANQQDPPDMLSKMIEASLSPQTTSGVVAVVGKTLITASSQNQEFRDAVRKYAYLHEREALFRLLGTYSYLSLTAKYARDAYNFADNAINTINSMMPNLPSNQQQQLSTVISYLQNVKSNAGNTLSLLGLTPNSSDDDIANTVGNMSLSNAYNALQAVGQNMAGLQSYLLPAISILSTIAPEVAAEAPEEVGAIGGIAGASVITAGVIAGLAGWGLALDLDTQYCNSVSTSMGIISADEILPPFLKNVLQNAVSYKLQITQQGNNLVLNNIEVDINEGGIFEVSALAFFPSLYMEYLATKLGKNSALAEQFVNAFVPLISLNPSSCVVPFYACVEGQSGQGCLFSTYGSVLISRDAIDAYINGSLNTPTITLGIVLPQAQTYMTVPSVQSTVATPTVQQSLIAMSASQSQQQTTPTYILSSDVTQWVVTNVNVYIAKSCNDTPLISFTCSPNRASAQGGMFICQAQSIWASPNIDYGSSYSLCMKYELDIPMVQSTTPPTTTPSVPPSLGNFYIELFAYDVYTQGLEQLTTAVVTPSMSVQQGTGGNVQTPPSGSISDAKYYVTAQISGVQSTMNLYLDTIFSTPSQQSAQMQIAIYMLQQQGNQLVVQQPQVTISFSPTGNALPQTCAGQQYTDENGNVFCVLDSGAITLATVIIEPGSLVPSSSYWSAQCPLATTVPTTSGWSALTQALYVCGVYQCSGTTNNTCPAIGVQLANIGFNGTITYQVVATNITQVPASCNVQSPQQVTIQTPNGSAQGFVILQNEVTVYGVPYQPGSTFGQTTQAYITYLSIPLSCLPDLVSAGASIYLLLQGNLNSQPVVIPVPLVAQKPLLTVQCSGYQGQTGPGISVNGAIVVGTKLKVLVAIDVLEQDQGNAPAQTSITASVVFPNNQTYDVTNYCIYYAEGASPSPCASPITISPGTTQQYVVEIDLLPLLQNNPSLNQYMAMNTTLSVILRFVTPNGISLASCITPAYVGACAAGILGSAPVYVPATVCPIHWRHPVCFVQSGSNMGGVPVLLPGQNATVICYLPEAEFPTDVLLYAVPLPTTVTLSNYSYSQLNDVALQYAPQYTPVKIPANTTVSNIEVVSFPITAQNSPGIYAVPVGFVVVPLGYTTTPTAIRALSAPPIQQLTPTNAYLLDIAYAYYIVQQSATGTNCPAPGQIILSNSSMSVATSPGQSVSISYYIYNNSPYDLTLQCSYMNPFTQQLVNLGSISLPHDGEASISTTINVPTNAQPATYSTSIACSMYNASTNTSCGNAPAFAVTISVSSTATPIQVNCPFNSLTNYAPSCTITLQCSVTNNSSQAVTLYPAIYDNLGNLIQAGNPVQVQPGQTSAISVEFTTPNTITQAVYEIAVFTTTPPYSLPSGTCSPSTTMPYCQTFAVTTSPTGQCPTKVTVTSAPPPTLNLTQLLEAVLALGIMGALVFGITEIIRHRRERTL